ncbi:MAG TPA: SDR family oxidoreductase [Acidimicrobiales bacterium]|nr:SDR family oxidoreductase [Acidimicrobiales bacterium]
MTGTGTGTVLVTGAGGYVGSLLVRHYRDLGVDVVAHGRTMGDLADADPFTAVTAEQRDGITHIVHSGAITRFDVERDTARTVNVEGTEKVLDFARSCPRLESFGMVSTVYSTGLRAGPIEERAYDDEAGFANDYEWSKWEAERLVATADDLPWRILRVATVIADDDSGCVTQYNAFHETLKLWFHGLLPLVPGDADTVLYLVTGDFVTSAIVTLMDLVGAAGVYHVAHAAERSLTLAQALDVVSEAFEAVESFRRRRVLRPLLGDRETFDLLASGVGAFGGGLVRQSLGSVVPFARQLFVAKQVDNARLRHALGDAYQAPDPAELVRRTCEALIGSKWGRNAVA